VSDLKRRPATFTETLYALGFRYEAFRQTIREDVQKVLERRKNSGREGTATLNRELVALLRSCEMWATIAPKELTDAIERQLGVAGQRRDSPRAKAKRQKAIQLLVKDPNLSSKKLAKASGVRLPTITRWRQESSFRAEVQFASEIPSLEARGLCKTLGEVKARRQFFVEEAIPRKFFVEES